MAFGYKEIIQSNYEVLQGDLARANGELEAARLGEDADAVMATSRQILEIRKSIRELDQVVSDYTAQHSRQAPLAGEDEMSRGDVALARKYGLTSQQVAVAKGWTSDPKLSDESKVKTYIENANRYRQARADGLYRDDNGRVTR